MAVVVQVVRLVDSRLIHVPPIATKPLRREGLDWFVDGDNHDYFSEDFVKVTSEELQAFQEAAQQVHRLGIEAAQLIASKGAWQLAGIPKSAVNLVQYSLQNELDNHLVSRFDFAGGIMGKPIKLLEFNADTCSLMCETALIQEQYYQQEKRKLPGKPFNNLINGLSGKLHRILQQNPDKEPTLLVSTLGYEEDKLTMRIIEKAAFYAGFKQVVHEVVEKVIFSPTEGIFIENEHGEFPRFDFWFKFMPWEMIAYEEEELLGILESIIINKLCVVMNPAYAMLLQSKAIMKFMFDIAPHLKYNLKTSFNQKDFSDGCFVRKPIFGRIGDNIAYYLGGRQPEQETKGDHGHYPPVFQEIASFNEDMDKHRYQPSMYWTGEPSALCFRRQDDWIIDDDAEFTGHIIEEAVKKKKKGWFSF